MKKIVKAITMILMIGLSVCPINAKTQTIRYYSLKEWVTYYDFFDKDFKDATQITNSQLISANLNGFGPYSFNQVGSGIYPISKENFDGKRPLVVKASGEHEDFYSTFAIKFGTNIQIDEIMFGVEIKNSSGELLEYEVYLGLNGQKEVVYSGNDENIVTLNFNSREIDSLYIRAKKPANGNIHTLKYFKINKYKLYEHVKWVDYYIADTETYDQIFEEASGTFYPNDGANVWKQSHNTLFVPSTKIINDNVKKIKIDDWLRYNDGLRIGIKKDSLPDYEAMYMWNGGDRKLYTTYGYLPNNKPFYWKKDGNNFIGIDKESEDVYIKTNKVLNDRNVYMKVNAVAVYCENSKCQLASEGGGKVDGHHKSDISNNAYDSYISTYYGEACEAKNYIKGVRYYLVNEEGTTRRYFKSSNGSQDYTLENKGTNLVIDESGRWRIEAEMINAIDDKTSVYSGLFLVDRDRPSIYFNPFSESDTNEPIDVTIKVDDRLSGIDKWCYALSYDGGKTYGPYTDWIKDVDSKLITLSKTGKTVIKAIAIDKAGNKNEAKSAYYNIVNDPPLLILKDNVYYVDESVSSEKLIENAIATDAIDGDISKKTKVVKIEYPDGRVIENPSELDTSKAQEVNITYVVTNSSGLSDQKTKKYPIIDTSSSIVEIDSDTDIYTRYIDEKNFTSLNDASIWKIEEEYKRILMDTLSKNEGIKYQVN